MSQEKKSKQTFSLQTFSCCAFLPLCICLKCISCALLTPFFTRPGILRQSLLNLRGSWCPAEQPRLVKAMGPPGSRLYPLVPSVIHPMVFDLFYGLTCLYCCLFLLCPLTHNSPHKQRGHQISFYTKQYLKDNQCSCFCLLCLDKFKQPVAWTNLYYVHEHEVQQFLLLGSSKTSLVPSFSSEIEGLQSSVEIQTKQHIGSVDFLEASVDIFFYYYWGGN